MTILNHDELARTVTDAGKLLLENGAETNRVEDTMTRLCYAFGASIVDAYATPTLLMISFTLNDQLVHNIKRVHISETNLSKIDEVNTLSREACSGKITFEQLQKSLDEIKNQKAYSTAFKLCGAAITSFGFALFFGGTVLDALCSLVIGILIQMAVTFFTQIHVSSIFKFTLSGFLLTALSVFSHHFIGSGLNVVTISTLMLLVPGLAITNAIKDSVNGDLVSGLARGVESVLTAISIALGSGICLFLLGGLI